MRNFRYLTILSLLLISCPACKDDVDYEGQREAYEKPLPGAVQEARNFFESYVAEVNLSEEMAGLYPGNFAPDWSKAVVAVSGSNVCVNVPIVSEVVYEGTFELRNDPVEGHVGDDYYTAIGQKLLITKEPDKDFGCYLVTIIPDEKNQTKSSDMAVRMYTNGGENTKFSGTTFFIMLGSVNYAVAAERYRDGVRYAAASGWWVTNGDVKQFSEDLSALLGLKQFYAFKRTMGKNGACKCDSESAPMSKAEQDAYNAWVASLGSNNPSLSRGPDGSSLSSPSQTASNNTINNAATSQNVNTPASVNNIPNNNNNTVSSSATGTTANNNPTSPANLSPLPRSHETPANYFYNKDHDVLLNLFAGKAPPNPSHQVISNDEANNGLKCGPNGMAYTYRLYKGFVKDDPKKHRDFYIAELEDGRYRSPDGKKLDVERLGVLLADLKHYICENPDSHFNVNADLSNSISDAAIRAHELYKVLDKNVLEQKNYVVLSTIRRDGIDHFIVIVGYRKNGDVIYMDPAEPQLRIVAAGSGSGTSFIQLDKCAIVIEGVK